MADFVKENASTIRGLSADCLRLFKTLSRELQQAGELYREQITIPALLDELGRFKIWAGNIGALQGGRSSLDYRLGDAPHISNLVVQILRDLEDSLKQGLSRRMIT